MTVEEALVGRDAERGVRRSTARIASARVEPGKLCDARARATATWSTCCAWAPRRSRTRRQAGRGRLLSEEGDPCPFLERRLVNSSTRSPRRRPTPGGGSASALAGALGASLLLMVSRMPKTRSGTDEERASLDEQATALHALRQRLSTLVDEDSAGLRRRRRAPSGSRRATDEEKAARTAAVQDATRVATETPLARDAGVRVGPGVRARRWPLRATPTRPATCASGIASAGGRCGRRLRERGDQPAGADRRGRAGVAGERRGDTRGAVATAQAEALAALAG